MRIRSRFAGLALGVSVLATGFTTLTSTPALANCTGPNRYARVQDYNSEQNQGIMSNMHVQTGNAMDWSSGGFIAQAMWEGIDNTSPNHEWVETGSTKGWEHANTYTLYWAWGDNDTGVYHEHEIGTPNDQTDHSFGVKITNPSNGLWKVWYDGSVAEDVNGDKATLNKGDYSNGFATGMESTDASSTMGTSGDPLFSAQLTYLKDNGNWSADWGSSAHCEDSPPDGD